MQNIKMSEIEKYGKSFYLRLDSEWFNRKDIIESSGNIKLKVLSKPRRKWYHLLLQKLTFGLYKARWEYKVKQI